MDAGFLFLTVGAHHHHHQIIIIGRPGNNE
jgi:hypothetical protein